MDATVLGDLIARHQWVAVASMVIGLLVRLMKQDTSFPPFAVAARWRPWLALSLGVASGVLQAVSTGKAWSEALAGGLVSAVIAIAGHDAIVDGLRGGSDVPIPGLTKKPKADGQDPPPPSRPVA